MSDTGIGSVLWLPRTPGLARPHKFVAGMHELSGVIRDALQGDSNDVEHDVLVQIADLMGIHYEDPDDGPHTLTFEDPTGDTVTTSGGSSGGHRDLKQTYRDNDFWTLCECGIEFSGMDPDEADSNHQAHREIREAARG